jgi:hypothetical protein
LRGRRLENDLRTVRKLEDEITEAEVVEDVLAEVFEQVR